MCCYLLKRLKHLVLLKLFEMKLALSSMGAPAGISKRFMLLKLLKLLMTLAIS